MSGLLYEVKTNRFRAFSIFPQSLKIYEDYITFRKRVWFNVSEITMTSSNIAQVNLVTGILFATIQIVNTSGAEDVSIPHVFSPKASRAKKILDQKLYQIHTAGIDKGEFERPEEGNLDNLEKTLNRMRELVQRGKMSEKEYEAQRKRMVRGIS